MPALDTSFVPADLDVTSWENIEPMFQAHMMRTRCRAQAVQGSGSNLTGSRRRLNDQCRPRAMLS